MTDTPRLLDDLENYEDSSEHWRQAMYVAFCRRTGCDPVEVALVEQERPGGGVALCYVHVTQDEDGELVFHAAVPWWRLWLEQVYRLSEQMRLPGWAWAVLFVGGLWVGKRRWRLM